ncbi:MAG: Mu transposase domain-containing protein, partial [bacterium]
LERVETRRVPKDAYVAVETNRYPVPFDWTGRTVTVRILSSEIAVHCEGAEPVIHPRIEGRHQVARWNGAPRTLQRSEAGPTLDGPPRFDPVYLGAIGQVDVRSLDQYEALVAEVGR